PCVSLRLPYTTLFRSMTNSVFACENGENFNSGAGVDLETWFLGQDENSIAAGQADVLNGIYTIDATPARDFTGDTFFDTVDFIRSEEHTSELQSRENL